MGTREPSAQPALGMRMMPETLGTCTCHAPALRHPGGQAIGAKPYPFLRTRTAKPLLGQFAYLFLRQAAQKWVRIPLAVEGRELPASAVRPVPVSAGRGAQDRTRFCEAGWRLCDRRANLFLRDKPRECVPISASMDAETGTLSSLCRVASRWPIRVFARRNRYGGERVSNAGSVASPSPRRVSAMKVWIPAFTTEPSFGPLPLSPSITPAETGTPYAELGYLEACTCFRG